MLSFCTILPCISSSPPPLFATHFCKLMNFMKKSISSFNFDRHQKAVRPTTATTTTTTTCAHMPLHFVHAHSNQSLCRQNANGCECFWGKWNSQMYNNVPTDGTHYSWHHKLKQFKAQAATHTPLAGWKFDRFGATSDKISIKIVKIVYRLIAFSVY